MSKYIYEGRIKGQDRLEELDKLFKVLLLNDPSLFCGVSLISKFTIPDQRMYEIELSTNNHRNFITLRDYICFN